MSGTGFPFFPTSSSSSLPLSSSASTSPFPYFSFSSNPASSSSSATPSSSPCSFSFSNPSSTSANAPSSSPSFGFEGFGGSTTSSSSSSTSASPTPAFGFASSTATASSTSSILFGASLSGSDFNYSLVGSESSPLFGRVSFVRVAATSSPFGGSTLLKSSTSSSLSGLTNLFGSGSGSSSGSSGSLFGSTDASSAFGSSAPSPASAFGVSSSARSVSPLSSGLFSSSSSAFGVSSSASTTTTPSFPSFRSSGSSGSGSGFAPSTPALSFPSGSSSVSCAPSFAFPSASAASSAATASGFSFPAATLSSSASSRQAFSFPPASSASLASSALGFSFSLSSGSSTASSSASSSPFLASSAPAFSFPESTGSSSTTTVSASTTPSLTSLSSLAASSSGFSFSTSGFQTSASALALALAFSSTPASERTSGTTSSPLFSTLTTTTHASTPASTTATSASIGIAGFSLNISSSGPDASSVATAGSTSGSAVALSGYTGFGIASTSAPSGTTTATTSSFSLSTKSPAAGSSQPQSKAAVPLSSTKDEEAEVCSEGEQVRVLEHPLVQMNNRETNHNDFSEVGQDQGGKSGIVKDVGSVEEDCESFAVACSTTTDIKELEVIPDVVPAQSILLSTSSMESASVVGDAPNVQPTVVDIGKEQSSKDVAEGQEETLEDSSLVFCQASSAFCLRIGLDDEEELWSEGEQVRVSVLEQPLVEINDCKTNHNEFSEVGQDQGGKSNCVKDVDRVKEEDESFAVACCITVCSKELEAIHSVVPAGSISLGTSTVGSALVTGDAPNIQTAVVDMGKQQPSNDVAEGQEVTSEDSYVVSEVVRDEGGASNAVGQALSSFSCSPGLNSQDLSPSDAQMIVKSILDKRGDITKGSIVKSMVMRSTFLHVLAEVVHRLCNLSMNTLGSDELQLMLSLADDAASIGFSVDWLQERLKKVSIASKYHKHLVHLERLDEQINAAKKSLMEMELQQLIWKKEVERMKVELEGIDFEGSNLGAGLI